MDELILSQPEGCTVLRYLDQDLERRVRGLVEVDRAVFRYKRRLEANDWPNWVSMLPADVRDKLIGTDDGVPF